MIQSEIKMGKKERKEREIKKEKVATLFIYVILIFSLIVLFFTLKSMLFPNEEVEVVSGKSIQNDHFVSGGFTEYDLALAKELMDKDEDGKCDVCGMDIDFCIKNGQLQCNMGGKTDELNIGALDKTKQKHHYHADLKVYLNGENIDLNNHEYFIKSRFMHVENDVQGDTGKVLHMHATGVPLWIFFDSIGMKFSDSINVYVNNELNSQGLDYVFNDLDKILITDVKGDLQEQLNSVTSFSENH